MDFDRRGPGEGRWAGVTGARAPGGGVGGEVGDGLLECGLIGFGWQHSDRGGQAVGAEGALDGAGVVDRSGVLTDSQNGEPWYYAVASEDGGGVRFVLGPDLGGDGAAINELGGQVGLRRRRVTL